MPEHKRLLITGATGFLGSHLTYELLGQGRRVAALVRPSKTASARERLEQTLRQIAPDPTDLGDRFSNLEVIEGDIGQDAMGLTAHRWKDLAGSIDEVWHCAASLSFTQEDRNEIMRMNVDGTQRLLDFVQRTASGRLHHVSTAYVAGNRTDLALEDEIYVGQTFKNLYEESKCKAELLVRDAHATGSVRATVYRPSIVIGDSKTGRVTHFHGAYAFVRGLWSASRRLRRGLPNGAAIQIPMRVLGSETTTLNFAPIDYVIGGMLAIAQNEASVGKTYHLTNPAGTPNRLWLSHICRLLGVEGIRLVDQSSFQAEPPTQLEALFQKQMAFYYMYLQGEPQFDCCRTSEILENTGIRCPVMTVPFIEKITNWYVDLLNSGSSKSFNKAQILVHDDVMTKVAE